MDEKNQSSPPAISAPESGAPPIVSSENSAQTAADSSLNTASSTTPEQTQNDPAAANFQSNAVLSASNTPIPSPAFSPPAFRHRSSGNRFPWIFVLVVLLISFLALATWYFHSQLQKTIVSPSATSQSTTLETQKVIVVGTDPTFQPME